MYTGIVQGLEKVLDIRQGNGFTTLVISNHQNFFMMSLSGQVWRLMACV
jgi:hypothetical protein